MHRSMSSCHGKHHAINIIHIIIPTYLGLYLSLKNVWALSSISQETYHSISLYIQHYQIMSLWAFCHLSSSPQFSINTDLDCHHETSTNFILCQSLSILQTWTVKTLQESNHLFITVHQLLSWLCISVIILGQSSSFTPGI